MGHVLLVEDDQALSRMLMLILSTAGIKAESALTGAQALASLKGSDTDLLVLDYRLPDMLAADLLAKARGQGYPGKVLLCSGFENVTDVEVDAYVKKPFEPEDLLAKVRELLAEE